MSHFGILVIGDDIEAQLQPYHEFECTGTNDRYVQDIDITAEVKALIDKESENRGVAAASRMSTREKALEALADWGLEDKIINDARDADRDGEHKYGFAIMLDGALLKAIKRTNPNKTWDWWLVGGRWSSWLKLKSGARADIARKGDIDFEAMRNEAGDRAAAQWDTVRGALQKAGAPVAWTTWEHMRDVAHAGKIEDARNAYKSQPSVKTIEAVSEFSLRPDTDQYMTPRADYIQQARDRATVLYAVVMGGQWIAKGDMGWWGMSHDKVSEADWCAKINSMIDALPDDTVITVVDCHI